MQTRDLYGWSSEKEPQRPQNAQNGKVVCPPPSGEHPKTLRSLRLLRFVSSPNRTGRKRGFIETIPGEHAWRAVHADGYMLIHCLWVVGKSKGKGFSSALLDACVADAKKQGMKGVAMVTSEKVWLAGRRVLDKQGFEGVDTAPPAFSLMVKKLGKHPSPSFAGGWDDKAKAFGKGLTVIRSDQCPYIVDAANTAVAAAAKAGIKSRIVELRSREDVMQLSPTAYGVFGLVLDGKLLSYHYQLEKDLRPLVPGGVL
ncbi:MAG: GNAT family N-acetyltransferase [Myxococcota bacterium]|nr:GNAT family N-acetyltransferase [Myxococcota bacterium]